MSVYIKYNYELACPEIVDEKSINFSCDNYLKVNKNDCYKIMITSSITNGDPIVMEESDYDNFYKSCIEKSTNENNENMKQFVTDFGNCGEIGDDHYFSPMNFYFTKEPNKITYKTDDCDEIWKMEYFELHDN